MSYSKINWENLPSENTPLNATNLNKMDTQIKDNADDIETNTSDISELDTRLTTAESNISNFNLTTYEDATSLTTSRGTLSSGSSVHIAKNSGGSLAKIYGTCVLTGFSVSSGYVGVTVSFSTTLRPSSAFTIQNAGIKCLRNNSAAENTDPLSITIATDGTVTTSSFNVFPDTYSVTLILFPMLYWIKDFGDEPDEPTA